MVLEQSGSSTAIKNIVKVTAAAVQRLRARRTRTDEIKKYVTGSQLKEIQSKIIYCTKEQFGISSRYDCCSGLSRHPSWALVPGFLVFPVVSWLPVLRVLSVGVAPNLRIL